MFVAITFLVLVTTYVLAAIMFSKSGVNMFYVALPVNRFAIVTKGGDPVKIIYNSKNARLVADPDKEKYPLGKFILINSDGSTSGEDLQKLNAVEKLLGIRQIGIPFIHGLLEKKMSWITIEGTTLKKSDPTPITEFAIVKTFGYKLEGLTLGKNSDGAEPDEEQMQRIKVSLKFGLQGFIENPHRAIIETNWMEDTRAKLVSFEQPVLGRSNQDELIARKILSSGNCEQIQAIIDNKAELEIYGVTFDPKNMTYIGYELEGVDAERIQTANTERYEKKQKAAGMRETKTADQADAKELRQIILDMDKELKGQGYSKKDRKEMIEVFLETHGIVKTSVVTLVKGGANTATAITAENNKKGK